jgi:hypothetical protein
MFYLLEKRHAQAGIECPAPHRFNQTPVKPHSNRLNSRRNSNLIVILTGKHEDSQIFLALDALGPETPTPPGKAALLD